MSLLGWIALALLVALGIAGFVIVTEGRYGGGRLVRLVYDAIGPRSYTRTSDAASWRVLAGDLHLPPNGVSLDVGCATGDLVLSWAALEAFDGIAVGVDRSRPMLDVAEKLAAERGLGHLVRFVEADLDDGLPFPDGSFTTITCLGVLEVIRRPDALAGELARVLAPGGRLAVSRYRRAPVGVRPLDYDALVALLRPAGFDGFEARPCRREHGVVLATRSSG
ncbi:MAG TPA: methyltransferase domain-containing protein [Actinomycetota bacterium]|nr:methyltransferase domain-containing protein [Actinomycetota bacterium]